MTQFKYVLKSLATIALLGFLVSAVVISCKKTESTTPPADKTALKAEIDTAQSLINTTTEGTEPGEYVIGSKAPLQTALTSAQTVYSDASATQTAVTNATAQLKAAISTYRANLIQPVAAANLVGFWKMNGNANDSSGHGHNGTVTQGHPFFGAGTPTLTTDRFGRANMAYHFDHGGNIEVPYSATLNPQQMTISLWCRMDTAGRTINPANDYMVSMNRWNGYKFQTQPFLPFYTVHAIEPAGDTTYYDRDDAGTAIHPGSTWYHLVVTFQPGQEQFYIDGSLVTTWPTPQGNGAVPGTPITVPNIDLTIGSDLPTSKYLTVDPTGNYLVDYGGFWTGDLDDVMFYNVALTAAQVSALYDSQKTP